MWHNRRETGGAVGIYVVGGRKGDGDYTKRVQVYYPATNTAANLGDDDEWPAAPVRLTGGVVEHDNKMYVFGGTNGTLDTHYADTWEFDPSEAAGNRWQDLGVPLSQARGFIYACVVDGYAYAVGGNDYSAVNVLRALARTERLNLADIAAGWDDAAVANLPGGVGTGEGRAFGFDSDAGHALAGRIILAGGGQWSSEWANCYSYDVASNEWSAFPSLMEARRNHAGALVSGPAGPEMWVFGGRRWIDQNVLATAERYRLIAPPRLAVAVNDPTPAVGDTLTVDVTVQPIADAFDAWGLIYGPGNVVYSFVLGRPGTVATGARPLAANVPGLASTYEARLLDLAIPPGTEGSYTIVVQLVPAGIPPVVPYEGYAAEADVTVR
ncbi:MAG: hypothetical protein PHN82_01675 [bacterium]|nr:hypothetical protein [bacterium]